MRGDPEEMEATLYDLVSRDWLAGVGGTCVCLHFILAVMKNRQLPCSFIEKANTEVVLDIERVLQVLMEGI